MVFSAASFSLGPPLDISAAMEKALAREESWGLGDAVNSMVPSVRSCSGTWPAKPQPSFPEGRQRPETQLKVPESRQSGTGDSQRVRSQVPRVQRCPLEQSRGASETSNQQESRVGTSWELKTVCKPTAQNAGSPAPTPRSPSLPLLGPRSGPGPGR